MSLNLTKTGADVPLSLDVLKLVEKTASDVLACIAACYHSNGVLSESSAIKNLHNIRGEMLALKNMLGAIS
jgi:hypothetical protein